MVMSTVKPEPTTNSEQRPPVHNDIHFEVPFGAFIIYYYMTVLSCEIESYIYFNFAPFICFRIDVLAGPTKGTKDNKILNHHK
jgi:hypothetical protein